MAGTHVHHYIHLIWSTYERMPLIQPEIERAVYRSIQASVRRNGATVLALGGVADHIHLLVTFPTTITVAGLVQDIKGVSSHVARRVQGDEGFFRWQHGFGVFSVDPESREAVAAYIRDQKTHHAQGTAAASWELATDPPKAEGNLLLAEGL